MRLAFLFIFNFVLLIHEINCDIEYLKKIDEKCTVSLQCISGCCKSDKCTETSECKNFTNLLYIIQLILCVVIVFIFIVYMLIKLRTIKAEFKKKEQDLAKQN